MIYSVTLTSHKQQLTLTYRNPTSHLTHQARSTFHVLSTTSRDFGFACRIKRDALSPLLFNFTLEYAIRRVQVNQDGLKLNGTHQILVYADDVNILGGSVHTIKENSEALIVASKEIVLEVNADKTKYMVMSRDENAGRSSNIKIENGFFERGEDLKYLGTILTDTNSIQAEIKSILKSDNDWYHSVQNILSSTVLYRNAKINIYGTIILPSVLYGCETWSPTLR